MLTGMCIFRAHLYAVSGYTAVCGEKKYARVFESSRNKKCETQKVSVRSCWHVRVTAEVHLWDTAAVQDFFLKKKKCVN